MRVILISLLTVASLAGCSHLPPPFGTAKPGKEPAKEDSGELTPVLILEPPAQEEARQVGELAIIAQRYAQMSPEDRKRELNNATQLYNRDKGTYNRLRLALLLMAPVGTDEDEVRAASLLEPYATTTGSLGPLRSFAVLIHTQLAERLRADRRADQLKEQLDALRAVERSMIERVVPPPPRKP